MTLSLQPLKQIGQVVVSRSLPVRGSGSDVTLNSTDLTRLPFNNSFPAMLIQLPGAVRGANGVVHINGDHGVINYQINGVALPQGLNRDIGSEINLNDLSYVDVIEGAYPAQYGLKFGSILNLTTKSGIGPAGFDERVDRRLVHDAQHHAGLPRAARGRRWLLSLASAGCRRRADSIRPTSTRRTTTPATSTNTRTSRSRPAATTLPNVTFVHSYGTYQIPNDVNHGEPATTDDNETQEDSFFELSVSPRARRHRRHHVRPRRQGLGDRRLRRSRQRLDLRRGAQRHAAAVRQRRNADRLRKRATRRAYSRRPRARIRWPTAAPRSTTSCRPTTRSAFGRHELRAGVSYDLARIDKNYAITLQPNNFLAPILTPRTPEAATTVVDDAPNLGNTYQILRPRQLAHRPIAGRPTTGFATTSSRSSRPSSPKASAPLARVSS